MELIERYLQAVQSSLPAAQQDDIIKELRDNILSQIEEREESLGRPLNEDEQVEMLKKLGSPARLAASYRKQQYIIGGSIFPIYWKVLKLALGIAFLVQAAASVAMAAAGKTFLESISVIFHYPSIALTVFAWVTLVFAALDFFGAKFKVSDQFDPRKLPPLKKERTSAKSHFELIAKLVSQVVFGVWWLAGLHYHYLIIGPGSALLNFGPIWHRLYPLFVLLVLIDVSRTAVQLYQPNWPGLRLARVLQGGVGLVVLYFLVTAPDILVASDPNSPQLVNLARTVSYGLHIGLISAAVIKVILLIKDGAIMAGRKLSQAHLATISW